MESADIFEKHVFDIKGVIINGFLLWVDIQRKITPENIWKAHAIKRFMKDEIKWYDCANSTILLASC